MNQIGVLVFCLLFLSACGLSKNTSPKAKPQCSEKYIFMTLKGQVNPKQVEHAFKEAYGMYLIQVVSKGGNFGIYSFDSTKISQEDLINKMKGEQYSSDARCVYTDEIQQYNIKQ